MARQWILRQHSTASARVEPVETAAQIHWRRRHKHPRVALRPLIMRPGAWAAKRPPLHFSSAPASHIGAAPPPPPPNSRPNPRSDQATSAKPRRRHWLALLVNPPLQRCPRANPVAPRKLRRASDPTPGTTCSTHCWRSATFSTAAAASTHFNIIHPPIIHLSRAARQMHLLGRLRAYTPRRIPEGWPNQITSFDR